MKSTVIGLGNLGPIHASILREQGHELCAVCDVDETKLEKFPDVVHYTDYKKMLDEVKPDVVHVCTPHYLHAEMILAALERDVSVLCEKPLCIREEDIPKIIEAEKKSKGIVGVCHQNRYNPENIYVRDLLRGKKVNSVTANVVWARDEKYYASGEWRGKWATEGGGVLINQALHTLDLVQWMVGMPEYAIGNISNFTHRDCIEVEDTATVLYEGKTSFSFFATTASSADFPVEIVLNTELGIIRVTDGEVYQNGDVVKFGARDKLYGKACYGIGHDGLIGDFYDHVKRGKPFQTNAEEASKVVRLILAAYRTNGTRVRV